MKRIALTLAIVLTMGIGAYAQYDEDKFGIQPWFGSSLLGRDGNSGDRTGEGSLLNLPGAHDLGTDQPAPVGSGLVLLTTLGAAYLVGKRFENRNND